MRAVSLHHRRGFTLVELLVTISVIVVLVAMFGGAISAARNGAQANTTTNAIARLDQIVITNYRLLSTRSVPSGLIRTLQQPGNLGASGANASAARAWHIRRNVISGDMPDRWSDVRYMATGTAVAYVTYMFPKDPTTAPIVTGTEFFPLSTAQHSYVASYKAAVASGRTPSDTFGGAECLFMMITQGGFANCLDCNGLAQFKKGDKDRDGALEFWDDWNNPIDYILWAPGFRNSGDEEKFFKTLDKAFPSKGSVRAGLGMQPLVYSAGPDGKYGLERNSDRESLNRPTSQGSVAVPGGGCGDPDEQTTATSGGPAAGSGDARTDNIVNVEFKVGS